jgi:hypothetical protein
LEARPRRNSRAEHGRLHRSARARGIAVRWIAIRVAGVGSRPEGAWLDWPWWWTTLTVNVVPDYLYTIIPAPRDDIQFWCLSDNASCGREDWWAEWNDIGSSDLVQFAGPGDRGSVRRGDIAAPLYSW